MDFLLGINLVILGVVLLILWYIYKNRSTPTGQINHQEIASPIIERLTDIVYERLAIMDDKQEKLHSKLDDKQENHNRNNLEMRTSLETRLGEIKNSLLEEVSKTQVVHSKSLSDIQTRIQTQLTEAISNINQQNKVNFDTLSKTNHDKLTEIQGEIDNRLNENLKRNLESFALVKEDIGKMQSTAQKMMESTKSVDKLNNIFERTNSKGFGQFSETYLETLLSEYLNTRDWKKQVSVPKSNDVIDFVINMGDKKIGIDSKFPVTKYQDYLNATVEEKSKYLKEYLKSVKLMASDISKKYHKPGFIDVLLLFLPSDSMYVEVANDEETMNYLHSLKVTPICSTTIFPIIVVINNYIERAYINENAEQLLLGLQKISKNVVSFRDEFRKLGDKIRQAQENYDKADKNLIGLKSTVDSLQIYEENAVPSIAQLESQKTEII
jgi:DNA anti-recombination protein RmuC